MKNRQYGLDILRIMAMLLITAIHYVAYSGVTAAPNLTDYNRVFISCIGGLFVAAVNLFVLITGYFSCEKNINFKRIFVLWVQVVALGVVLDVIGSLLLEQPLGITTLLKTVFPISTMHYWFFTMYVLLMLVSPIINILISCLTERQHATVCIGGFLLISILFVSNPFINSQLYVADARGIVWFVYLYIVGAGFKKYAWRLKRWKNILGVCAVYLINVVLQFFEISSIKNCQLLDGNSVFPFALSVLLFCLFKDIDVKHKISKWVISAFSACSFLIYILQEHDLIRAWYWNLFDIPSYASSPYLFVGFIISILALWPIALIVQYLFNFVNPAIVFVYTKIEGIIKKILVKRNGGNS